MRLYITAVLPQEMYEDTAQHIERYLRTLTDFSRAAHVILDFRVPSQCRTLDVCYLHNVFNSSLTPAPRPIPNFNTFLSKCLPNDSGVRDASLASQENGSVHPEAALMALAHSVYLGEDGVLQRVVHREGLLPVSRNPPHEVCIRADVDVAVFRTDAHRNQPPELHVLCRLCTPPLESWKAHPQDARG